jgi:hypothetical protein
MTKERTPPSTSSFHVLLERQLVYKTVTRAAALGAGGEQESVHTGGEERPGTLRLPNPDFRRLRAAPCPSDHDAQKLDRALHRVSSPLAPVLMHW